MATTTTETSDGPVLSVISKRLRNLRKKLNRITQMEHSLSLGKTLNPEQQDVLNSKPSVLILIDELTKLRPLLSSALDEELQNTLPTPTPQPINHNQGTYSDDSVRDLVNLMYFGTLFDVKQQSEFASLMFTRIHERDCCLTYDYVGDEDGDDVLVERDLDMLSGLQGLLVSRPVDSTLSHQNAIELCLEHANSWIRKADQPISSNSNLTYAALREKLNKIMSSDYFTATPQMKGSGEVAAAAAVGNFAMFQAPTQESMVNVEAPIQGVGSHEQYQEKVEDAAKYKEYEIAGHESGNGQECVNIKAPHKDEVEPENSPEVQTDKEQSQNAEGENYSNVDIKDQQYVHQRSQRGGHGRRSYPNGREGRGTSRGNGPHQNGRPQHYDNYYPKNNNYNRRGGRGGAGGGGGGYYNNSSRAQGNHSQENIRVES